VSPAALRWLAFFDVVGVPLLIACYIWRLQFTARYSWVILVLWLTVSFLVHRDTPKTLGWRADNIWPATRQAAVFFGVCAIVLIAMGFALGMPSRLPPHFISFRRLWNYFAFCLLQEVALQSLLNNRLMALVENRWLSSLLAGAIFGALHWPNPVLVPVTFVGGVGMAWLFAQQRNIIPLAVGQAILGSLVWWVFPVSWHHGLRVGPGYYGLW